MYYAPLLAEKNTTLYKLFLKLTKDYKFIIVYYLFSNFKLSSFKLYSFKYIKIY